MKTEDLFNIIDGIDDDIILDIPQLKAEKPEKIIIQKRAPFWSYVSIAAGFICVLAVGIFAATKIHGNITTSLPVTPSDITESGVTSSIPENNSNSGNTSEPGHTSEPGQTSTPEKTGPYYDDVFKEFYPQNPVVGMPMTYYDIMDLIEAESLDSFYLVETVRALSGEDAQALRGWKDYYNEYTIYEVRLLEDLIGGDVVDRVEKIIIPHSIPERQKRGDPSYAPGEKFVVMLEKPQEDCDFLHALSSSQLRYDVVEDESGTTLYQRWSMAGTLDIPGSEDIDEQVITSTTQNPAVYSQKIKLDELVSFLRKDWEQRGISSHFEDNSNSGNENPANSGTSQPGDPDLHFNSEHAEYSEVKELIKFVDVKESSDDEQNGIHGYEIEYLMPSKTPFGVRYEYVYGEVAVRDNSIVTLAPSSESGLYKRIEYGGRVFWRDLSDDLTATVIYISDDNIAYTALFMDETQAIEKIISLL